MVGVLATQQRLFSVRQAFSDIGRATLPDIGIMLSRQIGFPAARSLQVRAFTVLRKNESGRTGDVLESLNGESVRDIASSFTPLKKWMDHLTGNSFADSVHFLMIRLIAPSYCPNAEEGESSSLIENH